MLAAADAVAQAWKPDKAVEFVVGSAPGGGNDKTARTMQRIWQANRWLDNATVVNKVGGGGAIAYNYVAQHPADAHYVAVVRKALLANHILGRSPLNYTDMTRAGDRRRRGHGAGGARRLADQVGEGPG